MFWKSVVLVRRLCIFFKSIITYKWSPKYYSFASQHTNLSIWADNIIWQIILNNQLNSQLTDYDCLFFRNTCTCNFCIWLLALSLWRPSSISRPLLAGTTVHLNVDPVPVLCRASVAAAGPTLNRHRVERCGVCRGIDYYGTSYLIWPVRLQYKRRSAKQSQKTVSDHFISEQILLFGFAEHHCHICYIGRT